MGFNFSDWLINYEGGFVRRGLSGQLMLWIYDNVCNYSPKHLILAVCIVFAVIFALIMLKVSRELRITLFPLLAVLCGALQTLIWYRRDFMELCITCAVFMLGIRWLRVHRMRHLIAANVLMTGAILMHEGTFFYMVPLLVAIAWMHDNGKRLTAARIKDAALLGTLPLAAMAVSCLNKGSQETAVAIWQSWMPALEKFPAYGDTLTQIGAGPAFLARETADAILFHLNLSFQIFSGSLLKPLWCAGSLLVTLAVTYYAVIYNPFMDRQKKQLVMPEGHSRMGGMLLFQFLMMSPMLTVLSCDYGRTVMYCTASVMMMEYALRKNGLEISVPDSMKNCSLAVCARIKGSRILSSGWTYMALIVFYPISDWGHIHIPADCMPIRIITRAVTMFL